MSKCYQFNMNVNVVNKIMYDMNSIWFSEWLKNNRPKQFEKALERMNDSKKDDDDDQ